MSIADRLYYKNNKSSNGVKYIKVNKIDGSGKDTTNQLRNLQTFTINYTDTYHIGFDPSLPVTSSDSNDDLYYQTGSYSVEYPIVEKQEYPEYFLFYIDNVNHDTTFTSSQDYKRESFEFEVNIPTASYSVLSGSFPTSSVFTNLLSLGTASITKDAQQGFNKYRNLPKTANRYYFTKSPTSNIDYEVSFTYKNAEGVSPSNPIDVVMWKGGENDNVLENVYTTGSSGRVAVSKANTLSPQHFTTSSGYLQIGFPGAKPSIQTGSLGKFYNVSGSNGVTISNKFVVRAGSSTGSILYDSSLISESIQGSGVAEINPTVIGFSSEGYHITVTGNDGNQAGESVAPSIRVLPSASGGFSSDDIVITDVNFRMIPQIGASDGNEIALIVGNDILLSSYEFSDYNPLSNNANIILPSRKFQKVVRNRLSPIPENINAILNGVAEEAYVKDYYYELQRHTLPRYDGSKYTSNDFNLNSTEGLLTTPAAQASTYFANVRSAGGQAPELINATFIFTDYLINQNGDFYDPTILGTQAYTDYKYIFPKQGIIDLTITANDGSTSYEGMSGQREVRANGTLKSLLVTNAGTGSNSDALIQPIKWANPLDESGAPVVPEEGVKDYRILYTYQAGVDYGEADPDRLKDDSTQVYKIRQLQQSPTDNIGDFTYNTNDGKLIINSTPDPPVQIKIDVNAVIKNNKSFASLNKIRISRYDAGGTIAIENGPWQEIDVPGNSTRNFSRSTGFYTPQPGEQIQVEYFCEREKQFAKANNGSFTTKFQVTQQPNPTVEEPDVEAPTWDLGYINFIATDRGTQQADGSYNAGSAWKTSSYNRDGQLEDEYPLSQILRLEKPLTDNWGGTQILSESQIFGGVTGQGTADNPYGQGFSLPSQYAQNIIEPFNLRVGDEIRFGYDEGNTYTITQIVEPGGFVERDGDGVIQPTDSNVTDAAQYYYLYLDREIVVNSLFSGSSGNLPQNGSGLNLKDNFIFRRFLDDNTGLNIIYTKVNPGGPPAVQSKISPLYITQELQDNYGEILRDLVSEGVIQ